MSVIDNAVSWARAIAADNSHGYSQVIRFGPSYDCSSLVISAFQQAGVPVKDNGATYTGNMRGVFLRCGFKDVTSSINLATGHGLQKGDVLLNIVNHTALFIGNGQIVHARSSEGTSDTRDNSGNEIREQGYWNYPWDCVLRYSPSAKAEEEKPINITSRRICYVVMPELAYGSKGEAVKNLQQLLNGIGYDCGEADGDFGSLTLQGVKNFQTAEGIAADGIVGPGTWGTLFPAR